MTISFYLLMMLCLYGTMKIVKIISIHKKIKSPIFEGKLDNSFFIIIPIYKEQLRYKQCIEAMEKLKYPKDKVTVVFSCTAKEKEEPTTKSLIQRYLEEHETKFEYKIIEYPGNGGSMAEQVNYAYKTTLQNEDVVVIYNADSVPDPLSLVAADQKFSDKKINVVQQPIYFFNNMNKNIFSVGYSFHQTIFDMTINMWNSLFLNGTQVTGRGLFLRSSYVGDEIFKEQFFCEDIALSSSLVSEGQKIISLPLFENNESPPSLKDIIRQHSVWFSTASDIPGLYKMLSKHEGTKSGFMHLKLIEQAYKSIIWLVAAPFLWTMIILHPITLVFIYSYCLVSVALLKFKFNFPINKSNIFIAAFSFTLFLLVLNFGPILAVYKSVAARLKFKTKNEKYKTSRGS